MCGNLSSFTAPSHWCRSRPYSFVSVISFFLLPYPGTWGASCLLGGLTSSASVQWVFYRSSSTCRCISDISVGRKVISTSYSSAILPRPPPHNFLEAITSGDEKISMLIETVIKCSINFPNFIIIVSFLCVTFFPF